MTSNFKFDGNSVKTNLFDNIYSTSLVFLLRQNSSWKSLFLLQFSDTLIESNFRRMAKLFDAFFFLLFRILMQQKMHSVTIFCRLHSFISVVVWCFLLHFKCFSITIEIILRHFSPQISCIQTLDITISCFFL